MSHEPLPLTEAEWRALQAERMPEGRPGADQYIKAGWDGLPWEHLYALDEARLAAEAAKAQDEGGDPE